MKVDYIALSIPVFFILIGIEFLYGLKKNIKLYRLNDSITNIGLGIGSQVTGVFTKTILFYGYLLLYENWRFTSIENNFFNWLILFVGVDFCYYWFHRMSHEINALWAAHIVHHQSEDYNLSVALRQSWFQNAFSWVFYLPLALAGFDPVMFLTISAFNTLYQFWIHTRTIENMGPLEWVFNTPSHHRVHHGSDAKYLDKNHGGTLIIWDRLFGTFKREEEEPHYGITNPLQSWNPVWANLHYWAELFKIVRTVPKVSQKLQVFLKHPGWKPDNSKAYFKNPNSAIIQFIKYDSGRNRVMNSYLMIQFLVVIFITTIMLFQQVHFNIFQLLISSAWVILSISSFGALFEIKSWSVFSEYFRLLLLPVMTLFFYTNQYFNLMFIICLGCAIISLIWFNRINTSQVTYIQTEKN